MLFKIWMVIEWVVRSGVGSNGPEGPGRKFPWLTTRLTVAILNECGFQDIGSKRKIAHVHSDFASILKGCRDEDRQ